MEIFLVGGAVRDKLLGKPPKDCDYLVVSSTENEMLQKGFVRVGASYQVFLHPQTKEEYVLADNLEADLARRDLTINSMAMKENGEIVDPFLGREDLRNKILRHTSEHFSDDPLRVYRVARFKAQFPDFSIAEDTLKLMAVIARSAEFKNLHSNRICNELRTALQTTHPTYFFEVLSNVGAQFPEIESWTQVENVKKQDPLLRFASLVQNLDDVRFIRFCEHLGVPNDWREAGFTSRIIYPHIDDLMEMPAEDLVELLYKIDAFRKSYLLNFMIDLYGERMEFLREIFSLIKKISLQDSKLPGKEIGVKIKLERVNLVRSYLEQQQAPSSQK